MNRLTFQSHERDGVVHFALRGEFDLACADQVEGALQEIEERMPSLLVLDLRELTFMDSTGLRLLVAADTRARESARRLAIVQGPETVHRVFRITGLDDHLDIVESPPTAP